MKKIWPVLTKVSSVPYLLAFFLVTALAFVIGKIPSRGSKLFLLPWLDFVCGCLTLLVSVGLLHAMGLRGTVGFSIACAAWLLFYAQREQAFREFCRALAGFLAGWGLYRLC